MAFIGVMAITKSKFLLYIQTRQKVIDISKCIKYTQGNCVLSTDRNIYKYAGQKPLVEVEVDGTLTRGNTVCRNHHSGGEEVTVSGLSTYSPEVRVADVHGFGSVQ